MVQLRFFLITVVFISIMANTFVYATFDQNSYNQNDFTITPDTLTMVDKVRNRKIPVAFYSLKKGKKSNKTKTDNFQPWLWSE